MIEIEFNGFQIIQTVVKFPLVVINFLEIHLKTHKILNKLFELWRSLTALNQQFLMPKEI